MTSGASAGLTAASSARTVAGSFVTTVTGVPLYPLAVSCWITGAWTGSAQTTMASAAWAAGAAMIPAATTAAAAAPASARVIPRTAVSFPRDRGSIVNGTRPADDLPRRHG